jgi:hypothetical protein
VFRYAIDAALDQALVVLGDAAKSLDQLILDAQPRIVHEGDTAVVNKHVKRRSSGSGAGNRAVWSQVGVTDVEIEAAFQPIVRGIEDIAKGKKCPRIMLACAGWTDTEDLLVASMWEVGGVKDNDGVESVGFDQQSNIVCRRGEARVMDIVCAPFKVIIRGKSVFPLPMIADVKYSSDVHGIAKENYLFISRAIDGSTLNPGEAQIAFTRNMSPMIHCFQTICKDQK